MVTDNPRAVDDSSIQTKDQLNRVVFYVCYSFGDCLLFIFGIII